MGSDQPIRQPRYKYVREFVIMVLVCSMIRTWYFFGGYFTISPLLFFLIYFITSLCLFPLFFLCFGVCRPGRNIGDDSLGLWISLLGYCLDWSFAWRDLALECSWYYLLHTACGILLCMMYWVYYCDTPCFRLYSYRDRVNVPHIASMSPIVNTLTKKWYLQLCLLGVVSEYPPHVPHSI